MEEILAGLVASPAFRALIEGIAVKVVADIFHRRAADPNFLAESDSLFVALGAAKTPEDKLNAEKALQDLYSKPRSA